MGDRLTGALAGRQPSAVVEVALVGLVVAVYLLSPGGGPVAGVRWRLAVDHADAVVQVQRSLGVLWEPSIQRWALDVPGLVVGANLAYGALHFVVTPLVLVWLFRRRRESYTLWRNTIAFASLAAFAVYRLWPLAPPRLAGGTDGALLRDTLATDTALWSFESTIIARSADPLAAMPSMHAGWAFACAWALASTTRRPVVAALAWPYPAAITLVIVVTGNHYLADAVAGMLVVVAARFVAGLVRRCAMGAARPEDRAALVPLQPGALPVTADVG